ESVVQLSASNDDTVMSLKPLHRSACGQGVGQLATDVTKHGVLARTPSAECTFSEVSAVVVDCAAAVLELQADGDRVEDDFSSDLCAPLFTSVVVTSRSSNYAPALAVAKNGFEVRVELAGDAFNSCDSGAE